MKAAISSKITYIVIATTIFNCNVSFSYINKNSNDGLKIYCPEKVVCKNENNSSMCRPAGENSQYWNLKNEKPNTREGTYTFLKEVAYFTTTWGKSIHNHSKWSANRQFIFDINCEYQYSDKYPFPIDNLLLELKEGANFTPTGNNWIHDTTGKSTCTSNQPTQCPINENQTVNFSQFVIDQTNNTVYGLSLDAAANGIFIDHNYFVDLFFINYNTATQICGGVKECTFYIRRSGDLSDNYSSIKIDMTDNMKILEITNPINATYKFVKHPLFNTVQLIKN